MPADIDFSRRVHQVISPATERYVRESGQPNRVYAAGFDPDEPLQDYTQTHFEAQPARPRLVEAAARFVTSKIVGIPNSVMDGVIVPAFQVRVDDIVEHRLQGPVVQLADHTPPTLPVGTQFGGNLALARSDRFGGDTTGINLGGFILQSHGIGTIGYRSLGIRPIPRGPGVLIGVCARWATNTHYTIPATDQYKRLGMAREDRERYNGIAVPNLLNAMQRTPEPLRRNSAWQIHPANLYRECVINPVGTKQVEEGDRITIPRAKKATGLLVEALGASIVPVYTAFEMDEENKVIGGYCEVGEIIPPPAKDEGIQAVDDYLTRLAAYRSEHEGREVVYAEAA